MVKIEERDSVKLAGFTSLFIYIEQSSNFTVIKNIIKSTQTYYFHKDNSWEVPITYLSYLLDNITLLDDIELKLKEQEEKVVKQEHLLEHKTTLLEHQKEGILYGLSNDKFLLLDAPGLGKTLQILYLAEELKIRHNIEHVLVICGIASLRANWENEIKKHTDLSYRVIGKKVSKNGKINWSTIPDRAKELQDKIDEFFVIINIESLRDNTIINAIKKGKNKFDFMVVDEIHKCKNPESKQTKNLLELNAQFKIGATGTLITNTPTDSYVPLVWIGKQPKRFVTCFKNTFCVFDMLTLGRIVDYKNLDLLRDMIEQCSLRRQKDLLKLPPKTYIDEYLTMDDSQNKFYNDIKNSVNSDFKEIAKEECDKVNLKTSSLLSLITRLRQATVCPSMLTTSDIYSCKINRCLDLVEEITSQGDKVVIMSTFKEPVYKLKELLKEYNPLIATGDTTDEDITISQFQNDDIHKVFIGTIQKIGTGFTLNRASYMIMLDFP